VTAARAAPVLCGIILHPAGHTLSPVLHAEAYAELGLAAHYHAFDVSLASLRDAVAGMRALGLRQLSVSLPLKEAVLGLADRASPAASAIGAANTLTRVGEELVADNTDWIGVLRALEPLGPWRDARALVLGAGGAARAAVYALGRLGARAAVHARTRARAEKLAAELGAELSTPDADWDLLINATPVGMEPSSGATPLEASRLRPQGTVLDTVYRPLETRLLREARAAGCRTQDGLEMLVHQAVEQVRLWSGRSPSPARLRAAALAALEMK
jgi:shikimate dehydrogenase